MRLGRVIGTVVSATKCESLEGVKLLLLRPVDENGTDAGNPLVACDTVQAGIGDLVLWEAGREAALAMEDWFNPSDATIMGIVDSVDVGRSVDAEAAPAPKTLRPRVESPRSGARGAGRAGHDPWASGRDGDGHQ
jgi:ethanolamine utilization protein EutN